MGNPSLTFPAAEHTPCWQCSHFHGTGVHLGSEYVKCDRFGFVTEFFGDAERGCKFWTREPGCDDEPVTPK